MKSRRIYTANIGGLLYGDLTVPRLQAYAERVGAQLIVLKETKRRNPQHALLDAIVATAEGGEDDWNLWVDLDIVVRDGAGDVFAEYAAEGAVWGCRPGSSGLRKFRRFARNRGVTDCLPYFSTGMVLWNGSHARKLADAGMSETDWPRVGDQEVFNLLLRKGNVLCRFLPMQVHGVMSRQSARLQSDFVHFPARQKLRRIRNFIEKIES